jgi:hypothetical protein
VIAQTAGFSFAYLKELFLSSMMHWMAVTGGISMDKIIPGQATQLREQVTKESGVKPPLSKEIAKVGPDPKL